MGPFAALERFFERLFERPSARLFHARVQPIQLQRRVERAMENGRFTGPERVVVPNRYVVRLAPADLHAFGDLADSLELELADAALRFARAHHYALADRPAIRLVGDPAIVTGDVKVDGSFCDGAVPSPRAARRANQSSEEAARLADNPADPPASDEADEALALAADGPEAEADPPLPTPSIRSAGHPRAAASQTDGEPATARRLPPGSRPVPTIRPATPPLTDPTPAAAQIDLTRTLIYQVPMADVPHAILREIGPDGGQREVTFDGGPITVGRATDNFLVLRDSRVSRHHGRLIARQGALVYSDLASTNGSRVNGVEIDEVVLGAGDRIELGDTVLVVESVGGD
jgi:hypothetical protein